MNCSIDLDFADGEYTFRLPVPQIEELQRKCQIGIGELYARLVRSFVVVGNPPFQQAVFSPAHSQFHVLDIVETIRHGLIGGGKGMVNGTEVKVTPQLANKLVQSYVLDQPLRGNCEIAFAILGACIMGYDPPKKDEPDVAPAPETAEPTAG